MSLDTGGPVTHRRRPNWFARATRRAGAVLVILATLAAGYEVVARTPDADTTEDYFLRPGGIGDRVESLALAATVTGVRGGVAVIDEDGVEVHTDGVWMLVRMRVEGLDEPRNLAFGAIEDRRGRTIEFTDRVEHPLDRYTFEPGIPVDAELLFELPRDAVPGGRMLLYHELAASRHFQNMVAVDLGLTEEDLTEWLAVTEPLRVKDPEVVL
jgi:hypothetical protein